MTTLREFTLQDLFKFNRIMFDSLTEVYPLSYFYNKILNYPYLAEVATAPDGQIIGFLIGCRTVDANDRVGNGKGLELKNNHGHVIALSINNDYRCLGLGTLLMKKFTERLNLKHDLFVDLFVRSQNVRAIRLYKSLGYVIYRKIPRLYGDDDGYDMRLPLSRDMDRKCLQNHQTLVRIMVTLLGLVMIDLLSLEWLTKFFGKNIFFN